MLDAFGEGGCGTLSGDLRVDGVFGELPAPVFGKFEKRLPPITNPLE